MISTPVGTGANSCACNAYIGGSISSASVCAADVACAQCNIGCNTDANCPLDFNCAESCGGALAQVRSQGFEGFQEVLRCPFSFKLKCSSIGCKIDAICLIDYNCAAGYTAWFRFPSANLLAFAGFRSLGFRGFCQTPT